MKIWLSDDDDDNSDAGGVKQTRRRMRRRRRRNERMHNAHTSLFSRETDVERHGETHRDIAIASNADWLKWFITTGGFSFGCCDRFSKHLFVWHKSTTDGTEENG